MHESNRIVRWNPPPQPHSLCSTLCFVPCLALLVAPSRCTSSPTAALKRSLPSWMRFLKPMTGRWTAIRLQMHVPSNPMTPIFLGVMCRDAWTKNSTRPNSRNIVLAQGVHGPRTNWNGSNFQALSGPGNTWRDAPARSPFAPPAKSRYSSSVM